MATKKPNKPVEIHLGEDFSIDDYIIDSSTGRGGRGKGFPTTFWPVNFQLSDIGRPMDLEFLPMRYDPLLAAIERRTEERADAAAQVVVQGSLAYFSAKDFPLSIERHIPVDIYSKGDGAEAAFEALKIVVNVAGLNLIRHPVTVKGSTHIRATIETPPATPEEARELEASFVAVFENTDELKAAGNKNRTQGLDIEAWTKAAELADRIADANHKRKLDDDQNRREEALARGARR